MQQRHFYAQRGRQMFLQTQKKLFIRFYSTISIPSAPLMLQQWASATDFSSCSVFLPLWWNMFVSARHLRPIKILKEHFVCICQAQTTLVRHDVLVIWKRLVAASSTEVPNLVFVELEQTGVKDLGWSHVFSAVSTSLFKVECVVVASVSLQQSAWRTWVFVCESQRVLLASLMLRTSGVLISQLGPGCSSARPYWNVTQCCVESVSYWALSPFRTTSFMLACGFRGCCIEQWLE